MIEEYQDSYRTGLFIYGAGIDEPICMIVVDGIYLPTKTEKQNYDKQTGQLSYREEFIFKNSLINHPIPQETFTYKNLGLKDDDKFIDNILNREYTYKDEELIPLTKDK